MTEHFTREEAVALAKKAEVILAYHDDELGVTPDEILVLINDAVTTKQKEWEAQGAVAKAVVLTTGIGLQWIGEALPAGTKLYTHALPAQPAHPVNAEATFYGHHPIGHVMKGSLNHACKLADALDECSKGLNGAAYNTTVETIRAGARMIRAQAAPAVSESVREFIRVIEFAITQGSEAGEFLNAWLHGDADEWPEFSAQPQQKEG